MGKITLLWLVCLASLSLLRGQLSALPLEGLRTAPVSPGQFWHVSDLHLDPSYHITEDHTKVCASSKGNNASSPGVFGDFMCDSPYQLIQSAFKYMKDCKQEASFMIWTGDQQNTLRVCIATKQMDSPPHVPTEEFSTKTVIDVITNLTATIREFFPDLQVFPALGNHDYWPQDQMPETESEVYSAVADIWGPWLTDEAICTLRKGGFYSQLYKTNAVQTPLRIISLNTVLYYGPNKVTENMTDPANQLEWLENTLESSRQNKEKVYIIAHIPIGFLPFVENITAFRTYFNERLVTIFRKYSDVIAAQFYGHTHRDSIMVLLDEKDNPVNSLFVVPAVTPIKNLAELDSNNPGFRLYQYQPNDYRILDLWQFYLNLTEANMKQESNWNLEYIMTKEYGIEDLHPQHLYDLSNQFTEDHSKQFDKYYNNFLVSYNGHIGCEGLCKINQLCSIRCVDQASYMNCINRGGL